MQKSRELQQNSTEQHGTTLNDQAHKHAPHTINDGPTLTTANDEIVTEVSKQKLSLQLKTVLGNYSGLHYSADSC